MPDWTSLSVGVAIGLFLAKFFAWIADTRVAAKRPLVCCPKPDGYEMRPQNPFQFGEAALGNAIYKHKILGTDNVLTKLLRSTALSMFNKFRLPCPTSEIEAWATKHHVPTTGWDRPIEEYSSIDDFFTRSYKALVVKPRPYAVVSPSEGSVVGFESVELCQQLWCKQKGFTVAAMGVPAKYLKELEGGTVMVFKLDVNDVHRYYSPVSGKVVDRVDKLEPLRMSHSIRPVALNAGWSSFTENRRVLLMIENELLGNVAVMIVGGIAVDTVTIDDRIRKGAEVKQGQEIGAFHMGGSAIVVALPQNDTVRLRTDISVASLCGVEFGVKIGDVLTAPTSLKTY